MAKTKNSSTAEKSAVKMRRRDYWPALAENEKKALAQQEIDAYRGYIAEHPELDQERLDEFQQVIQDRTDEMDALDKAWEQSEANPDALSPGSSEADAAPSQAESPSESEGCSDSDDDGMSIGM